MNELTTTIALGALSIVCFVMVLKLFRVLSNYDNQLQRATKEYGNLVRDFAAYAATEKENYPGARMTVNAANRERILADIEKGTDSLKEHPEPESEPNGYTLVQRG